MKRVLLPLLICASTLAYAEDAKHFDFTKVLIRKDGKPFRECIEVDKVDKTKCNEEIDITLGWLSATALDLPKQGLAGAERTKRGGLAYKIITSKDIELSAKDVTTILDALDDLPYNNTAIYSAKALLDPTIGKEGK